MERDRLAIIVTTPGIQPVAGFTWSGGSAPEGADLGDADVPDLSDALEPEIPDAPTKVRSFDDLLRERDKKAAFRQALHAEVQGHVDGLQHARRPRFYNPQGCEQCAGTGYRGRVAIAEILVIDDPVRKEILNKSDAGAIQRAATSRGMRTLREDGARMVLLGITSLAEVLAATQASELTAPGGE